MPKKTELQTKLRSLEETRTQIIMFKVALYDENALMEQKEKLVEIKAELQQVKADDTKLKELTKDRNKVIVEIKEQKELLQKYSKLQQAFGRNGIPTNIIENVIPEIEETTNDILKGLDTPIRISIESQKDLKNGGKAETLDINVITPYGLRPYANYSGGEKTFIDFAIRIALSIILARRSNCQIQTLILDEAWEHLDSVNRGFIAKAIVWIKNKFDFKRVIIISHEEELQAACKNRINIVFDGKRSYVKS
jgi:exonuclease SbcC